MKIHKRLFSEKLLTMKSHKRSFDENTAHFMASAVRKSLQTLFNEKPQKVYQCKAGPVLWQSLVRKTLQSLYTEKPLYSEKQLAGGSGEEKQENNPGVIWKPEQAPASLQALCALHDCPQSGTSRDQPPTKNITV